MGQQAGKPGILINKGSAGDLQRKKPFEKMAPEVGFEPNFFRPLAQERREPVAEIVAKSN
jgi:hypothetical protein